MGSPWTWAHLELGTPGTLACLWNWALQGPWLVSGIGHSRDLGLSLELGTPGTLACLWNWALQGPWLVSGIGHSRDLGLSLELGTPGTLACLWNWALQGPSWAGLSHGPWLAPTADWSRQQSTGQAHTSLPLLLSLCKCVLTGPGNSVYWSGTHLAPTAALTLRVCSDWSWQQSTGQTHTSLPLLLSLCKCVLTGPGNRVLVRHTPCSHCCSLTAHHSLSAGHHSDVLVSRSAFSLLSLLSALLRLCSLVYWGMGSPWTWADCQPLCTLIALTAISSLTALLSQGTWSIGGWASHGPGQTGFQGSLAGPLKGDVLVSRSALSSLSLLSALSRLCSLKGPGLLGNGLPMDLGRLDFRAVSALSRLCSLVYWGMGSPWTWADWISGRSGWSTER